MPHLSLYSKISRPAADHLADGSKGVCVGIRSPGLLNIRLRMSRQDTLRRGRAGEQAIHCSACSGRRHSYLRTQSSQSRLLARVAQDGQGWGCGSTPVASAGTVDGLLQVLTSPECSQATAARQPSRGFPEQRRFEVLGVLRQTITLQFPAKTICGELATPTSGASL